MSDTLTIDAAVGDWYYIESEARGEHYVHEIIIAGNHVEIDHGTITVDATTWAIQSDLSPSLLIETPQHYNPEGRAEESDNDNVFFHEPKGKP